MIGGITDWITVNIVQAGIQQLALLSNPVGAVLEAIKTIYTTIEFVVTKMNKILMVVDAILDSVNKIAAGAIGDAATWIEGALARSVAPVIGFFADWLSIDSPGPEIQKIVIKIQDKVDQALDWLIDKAKSIAKSLFGGKDEEDKDKDEEDPKWKAGVAGVTQDIETMKVSGLEEDAVRAKIPLWKAAYGFSELDLKVDDDFEIVGSMSPDGKRVTKANSGLHSGTSKDPIPIYWYKPPGAYPASIALTEPDGSKITVPMFSRTKVTDPPPGRQGDVTLGVTQNNEVDVGKKLERTSGTAAMRTGEQQTLIGVLGRLGYDMDKRDLEADHVKDLGFGGSDALSNLWPLQSRVNQIGLEYYSSYMVEYIEGGHEKKGSLLALSGKFFTIKGFRYPPPANPGGRDSS